MHNNYRTSVPALCAVLGSMLAARTVLASSPPNPGDLVIVKANDTQIYRYQPGSGLLSALATARAPTTASHGLAAFPENLQVSCNRPLPFPLKAEGAAKGEER